MSGSAWSRRELDALHSDRSNDDLAAEFGRTVVAVRSQRQRLGIPNPQPKSPGMKPADDVTRLLNNPQETGDTINAEDLDELATLTALMDDEEPSDELIERIFEYAQRISDIGENLAPSARITSRTFPEMLPIGVCYTGDWHLGGGGVDVRQLQRDIETIGTTDGLYAVGMGDYVDGVSIHSKAVSALYDPSAVGARGLQNSMALIVARKAMGKWLAIIDGNHDAWSERHAAIGSTRDFAKALGAQYFHQGGGSIHLTVGTQHYNLAVRHNAPGHSRLNTTNAQRRMFDEWPDWINADAITLAHFHFNDMHQPSRKGGEVAYLRSGTYKLRDPYAANGGFTPEWGVPMVILYPDRKEVFPVKGNKFETGLRILAWERDRYARRSA
jgi:hypothetical protein